MGFLLLSLSLAFADVRLTVDKPSELYFVTQKKVESLAPNAPFRFDLQEPTMVRGDLLLPILLIPVGDRVNDIQLSPTLIQDAIISSQQDAINKSVSELFKSVMYIQNLLKNQKVSEASELIGTLQNRYPRVYFLNFIKASILALQGRKEEAKQVTQEGLKHHPDYLDGRNFLKALEK